MNNLSQLLDIETAFLLGKAVVLILIFLYAIFSLVILVNIRRLNDVIQIAHSHISLLVQGVFLIHLILVISLFFFALAIL